MALVACVLRCLCLLFAAWPVMVRAAEGAAPASSVDERQRFGPDWSPEDCGIFKLQRVAPSTRCGYVSVPTRHDDARSPRIKLAVVILPALDQRGRQPDPLFLAQGGPGGSTIGGFAQVLLDDPSKRPVLNRDLVLWDQRGTYFSQPRLRCYESEALASDASKEAQREAMQRCGRRLTAEASDLSAFNSVENARDADAVRAALGYGAFNFYGVSYGTELGQFLMRERPQHLRSVVLDAVVPIGFNLVTDVPAVKQRVMEQYARSCAQSPACSAAYPDLARRYLALLDRLDNAPMRLGAPPAADSRAHQRNADDTISGKDLDAALYQSIYMREVVSLIPYIVYRAEQDDFSFVVNFVQLMRASESDMADAMYMSVVCSEFGDTPEAAFAFSGVLKRLADAGRSDGRDLLNVCRDWNIQLLDKALLQPVRSAIPTLLLSGTFDPITPPAHAERVAATLDHAYRYTFSSGTHGQAFVVPCANRIIQAFLDAPRQAPDGNCAQESPPVFLTPDQLIRLPVRGMAGTATIQDHMLALAGTGRALVAALLLMFSAVLVYCITEIWRALRGRTAALPPGLRGRLIAAAPWVPVLAGFTLLGFLLVAMSSVGGAVSRNQMLLLVGVVPAWVKELTSGLLPFVAAMALMTLTLYLLWRHRARSALGRIYYTVLTVTGWLAFAALLKTGLFGL